MARVVVLGAGVSGHTAASFARKWLGREHEVVVVSPKSDYNWIPSNIWVGVGQMKAEQVTFPLAPIYERAGIGFHLAKAVSLHPEGNADSPKPFVTIESTAADRGGERQDIQYDYLINATGPRLNFDATEGLGPEHNSYSVCTEDHATQAAKAVDELIAELKKGGTKNVLVGTGHGTCTCQGAAFEYIVNLDFVLRRAGVRDSANLIWISNEHQLGDFGMGGMHIRHGGFITPSSMFTESIFAERGIQWITQAHVTKVDTDRVYYETLEGELLEQPFDFAMLLPPFSGVGLQAFDAKEQDITDQLFAPNGFMRVDADYEKKPYEDWKASDWPRTYQNPSYPNVFAAGIAFAPPHAISQPRFSKNGTPISPTPPRTGMPSATIGKAVAHSVVDMIHGAEGPTHSASMAQMGAACVASAGKHWKSGTAASMTVFPVVPDFEKYPDFGRDMKNTFGEIGVAGHWIKYALHHMFLYKAKLKPGWSLIPE